MPRPCYAPKRDDTTWLCVALRGPVDAVGDRFALTRREREVLLLTASGLHTKAVASQLGCAAKTVEEYWKRMFHKLARNSRQAIVALVLAETLAAPPEGAD